MTRKKKNKIKGKRLSLRQLKYEIARLFKRHPKKRYNAKQIIKKLKIDNNKDAVQNALEILKEEEVVKPISEGKFKLIKSAATDTEEVSASKKPKSDRTYHIGTVDMTRTGSAYIVCDDLDEDVHVSSRRINTALHGDKVKIAAWTPRGRRKREGEVVEVLERSMAHFLGTLRLTRKYGIVIPDKGNMPMDIYVRHEDVLDGRDGDKVVVKVTEWPDRHNHSPIGKITSVLGQVGSSDIEMKAILINNGFELEFPAAVIRESETLTDELTTEELERRRDMRAVPTFTIDPVDAKDFDDALSFQKLENDLIEIGVHIADVTHYIKANTALDREALRRSTSVYLVDRVLPMLPERLSNGLCSLRPNEDKFTFSAVFTFNKEYKIVRRWFGKTITHSNRRFTYGDAQIVLDEGEGDFVEELTTLNTIAKHLRKKRFHEGSVDFNADEVRFKLDENGTPVEVYVKKRRDTNMLIEEFMLLANKEVAGYMFKKGKDKEIPYVYRIHDEPDPEKVAELIRFAKEMGVEIKADNPTQVAKAYNKLAKQALQDESLKVLEPLAIRTMAKAEYSTDNIGHYGLGFEHYSHFTSPIRRYSDVLAHRILYENIDGKTLRTDKEKLQIKCKHISKQERKANDAERESIKYKQVEFMKNHIGETFDGVISGIIDRGIFVETVNSRCEGFVGFNRMWEPYEIGKGNLSITGKISKQQLKMGDQVSVRIIGADLQRRRIEMEMVGE